MAVTRVPVRQVNINFGTTPVSEASFTVTDARVNTNSNITGQMAYVAPIGGDLDEVEMEPFNLRFAPGTGQFTVFIQAIEGPVRDNYYLNYYVG